MDRSEPTLVPEWLKSSGSVSVGGSTNNQFPSSSSSSLHPGNLYLLTFPYLYSEKLEEERKKLSLSPIFLLFL